MRTDTRDPRVIGRCSICDGDVTFPIVWHGTGIPIPFCRDCGTKQNKLPTVSDSHPPARVYRED